MYGIAAGRSLQELVMIDNDRSSQRTALLILLYPDHTRQAANPHRLRQSDFCWQSQRQLQIGPYRQRRMKIKTDSTGTQVARTGFDVAFRGMFYRHWQLEGKALRGPSFLLELCHVFTVRKNSRNLNVALAVLLLFFHHLPCTLS